MSSTNSSTTRGTTSGTSTYSRAPGASSFDIDAMREHEFSTDPRIGYAFARNRRNARESFQNPMGGYTTPQLQDRMLAASDEDSTQQEAQAYREESHGRNALEYARDADVAAMTAPPLVQTGQTGTMSGTGSQQQSLMPGIVAGASGMGAALL